MELNYKELGLKVGLEIHRQIESHKLFCHCPSILRDDEPDIKIKRLLRAVSSEVGEKDIVAEYEMTKNKYMDYEAYKDTTCLVELDEEPIHLINQDALEVVLQVCKILNMKFVDEIQVMRKQVLDGSAVSGFQRTSSVARNGFIETKHGKVGIQTVCIEEDAARKITQDGKSITYRLDRLGIPLIEIATEPDMHDPEQAKEVAAYLGMILKSTGRFKSGLGTIRQDLNVSIKSHDRVEIKGVQDLRLIPRIVELEIKRQLENVKKGNTKGEVRKANPDGTTSFLRPMPGAARLYVETDHPGIKITKELISKTKIPELITEKALKLEKQYCLSPDMAREVIDNKLFFDFVKVFKNIEPDFIARTLIEIPKEIKARFNLDVEKLKDKDFEFAIENLNKGIIPKSAIIEILSELVKGNVINIESYRAVSDEKLEEEVKELIKTRPGISFNAVMGELQKKYKGRIDGKKAAEIIKEHLK
ncbi:MAG: Glu-tRNA(Gln) amidotransferase subunit GatE [Nanoarchaeota archaeon]